MGTFHHISLLLSLATLVTFSDGQDLCTRHNEFPPIPQFNNLRMLGNWTVFKVYAADAADVAPMGECVTARISIGELSWPLTYREDWTDPNGNERALGYWTSIDLYHWAVWSGVDNFLFPETYRSSVFVHTDYDNYAIQFSCTETLGETHLNEKMTIFTKTNNPDPELVAVLVNLVQTYGFSLDNEIPIDHSNCE